MKLSAVLIVFNEERNLPRCLESLAFCDEIIVVDSKSTDRTVEVARRYTDKVFDRPWRGYVLQRNEAASLASNDWILSIDADEVVSPELQEEIRALLGGSPAAAAYSVPRKTIHFGRWIRHGGWYPNRLVRLFRKSQGEWVGNELHERWEGRGLVGEIRADLIHHSFDDLADQVSRNNKYSSLGAIGLRKKGLRFSSFRLFGKSLSKFLETYIVKRGFLDGYPGLIIAVSAAYSVFLKWAKLWELENSGEKTG